MPVGDGFGSDKASRGALNGVLEKASGLQIGLRVNDVIETPILNPFKTNLGYSSPLMVQKKLGALASILKN